MNIALLIDELRRDEAVRRNSYRDTKGILTVGVGHNCQASPLPAGWKCPLTDEQINSLLTHDLTVTFAALDLHLPWWRRLDDVRQRVVANMAFNMGVDKLMEFHNTVAAIQAGNFHAAAYGMKASLWAKQVGDRAVRLVAAMETGVMPA